MKKTYYSTDLATRQRVLKAIQDLANIVGMTLGPGGRPILLDQENRPPLSTKDGVTVARHFEAEGDLEALVAKSAIEICEKTVREAGDGTTTAIILGAALVEAGQFFLQAFPTYSPQQLSRELNSVYRNLIKPQITALTRSIKDLPQEEAKDAIYHVALVSANHDEEIAKAVCEAVEYVGQDGMCIAEEGAGSDCQVKYDRGFSFNSGLNDLGGSAGPSFVNRQDYGDCSISGAYVCMYDGDINDPTTIIPLLEKVAKELVDGHPARTPLVVFAHRFSDQVLKMFAQNFRKGILTIVPVKTPRNGQSSGPSQFLHDLAAYAGGTVLDGQGLTLPEAHLAHLGGVESIKIGRSDGVILGDPDQERVEKRISELKAQMENASEFDCDLYRYRISRLCGAIATIYAGGKTQFESKERHARVTDAICAVRSAIDSGVVPGGGATLASIAFKLPKEGPATIFAMAFLKPFTQILDNAGINIDINTGFHGVSAKLLGSNVWMDKDGKLKPEFFVYDALKREFVEWWSGGIMDPAKVTLSVVENALSVAQLLMTLGGAIVVKQTEATQQVKQMQEGMIKAIQDEAMG